MKDEDLILQGKRNLTGGLWDIAIPVKKKSRVPQPSKYQEFTVFQPIIEHSLSVLIRKNETKTYLVSYIYASWFSPLNSALIKAIKSNQFNTRPGLTLKLVSKKLPTSITTTKRHINQKQQKLQSTKYLSPTIQIKDKDSYDYLFTLSDVLNVKSHDAAYTIV